MPDHDWNMCLNLAWLLCAIHGTLGFNTTGSTVGGQLLFSKTPSELDVSQLVSQEIITEPDIYYLEICILNEICANSDVLFTLHAGEPFYCVFDMDRYRAMQAVLTQWEND